MTPSVLSVWAVRGEGNILITSCWVVGEQTVFPASAVSLAILHQAEVRKNLFMRNCLCTNVRHC